MTDPTETGARDVAARIADALRGTTPGEWEWEPQWEIGNHGALVTIIRPERPFPPSMPTEAEMSALFVAPSLLRDALARIEADAAEIAALRAKLAALERTTCPECLGAGRVAAIGFDERLSALCPMCAGRGTVPHDGE